MSTSIDQVFIKSFEREVHEAYQRMGSLFRATVRLKNGVPGESYQFPIVGKGKASTKARHAKVPTMNVLHTRAVANITDFYAGDFVDKLDELKTNIDERQVQTNAGAYALGRTTDDLIIAALNAATFQTTLQPASSNAFRNSFLNARAELMERDVPMMDGWGFCAFSPRVWAFLMTVEEFASADYRGPDLPYQSMQRGMRTWMDVNCFQHSGLPKSGNTRTSFMYHRNAVGHAIGQDVTTDITWQGERAAWFINNMMSMGSVLIDNDGVQKLPLDESATLPTA